MVVSSFRLNAIDFLKHKGREIMVVIFLDLVPMTNQINM